MNLLTAALVVSAWGQAFQEVLIDEPRVVDLMIDSGEMPPNPDFAISDSTRWAYLPNMDYRWRLIGNSGVVAVRMWGPYLPDTSLSRDQCIEQGTLGSWAGVGCTPPPTEDRDRLELYWRDYSDYVATAYADDINVVGKDLFLPAGAAQAGVYPSLAFPGAELRFVSGPAVPYDGLVRWDTLPGRPVGEGSGFLLQSIELLPDLGRPTMTGPQVIEPHEVATGVLLGGGPDSIAFEIPGSSNPQAVAIWMPRTEWLPIELHAYARCGAKPTWSEYDHGQLTLLNDVPLFLELEPCAAGWQVVLANGETGHPRDLAFQLAVTERFAEREWHDIKVGIEFPVDEEAGEMELIKQQLEGAAWRLFGATGGTHVIRTFTFDEPGSCRDVTVCWRNRPAGRCEDISGFAYYRTGSLGTAHICADPRGFGLFNEQVLAHEFTHVFANVDDHYWKARVDAQVCDDSKRLLALCSHTLMSYGWTWRTNSLCTEQTHGTAADYSEQTSYFGYELRRSTIDGPYAITECANGTEVNRAGPKGTPAWEQMDPRSPVPHPPWTPHNLLYGDFATARTRNEIGQEAE